MKFWSLQLHGRHLVPNFDSSFVWYHRIYDSLLSYSSLSPRLLSLLMNSRSFSSSSRDDDEGTGSRARLRGEHAPGTSSPDGSYPLLDSRPRSSARLRSPGSISQHSSRSPELSFSQGSNGDQINCQPLNIDDHGKSKSLQDPPLKFLRRSAIEQPNEDASSQMDNSFLDKFNLDVDNDDNSGVKSGLSSLTESSDFPLDKKTRPPLDAEEIFKKMKETGLIPNAVAMLDSLCKDGLVQEAMKLFGFMREKGTIPEVVVHTAVVEGFCKAQNLVEAIRIFRKMQNNGITPNAFSYTVLIQGLCKCNKLDDAVGFCLEMLESGHSPNLTTFLWLVDGLCKDKGVEEAQAFISTVRQKGFVLNEKAVGDFLNKKAPFSPMVREAVFGKKSSAKPF